LALSRTQPFVPIFNKYALPALGVAACALFAAGASRHFLRKPRGTDEAARIGASLSGVLLVWLIVFGFMPAQRGSTFGMRLLGLKVIGEDGGPAPPSRHLIRTAGWLIDGLPFVVPGAVGLVCILVTPSRRRVGDFMAHTYVVRTERRR